MSSPPLVTRVFGPVVSSSPRLKRALWKRWYEFLAGGYRQEDWTFMNYGFAGEAFARPALDAADEPDRCSIQLYHAVAGAVDLTGKSVLEVGSGRGGGCSYMARYLRPASVLGVDYSANAVELSQKRHNGIPNLQFQQGDAEALPCADATFDTVVNVESSHCYASMDRFLGEVLRVLKPGGYFLWADMGARDGWPAARARFEKAGFVVRQEEQITPGVLLALDAVTDRKREMIGRHFPKFMVNFFADFAGVRGTRVYESLRAGNVEYWRCALQKPGAPL